MKSRVIAIYRDRKVNVKFFVVKKLRRNFFAVKIPKNIDQLFHILKGFVLCKIVTILSTCHIVDFFFPFQYLINASYFLSCTCLTNRICCIKFDLCTINFRLVEFGCCQI